MSKREKLIEVAREHVMRAQSAHYLEGAAKPSIDQLAKAALDAILAELRGPDEGMRRVADECDSTPENWPTVPAPEPSHEEVFTAMIDHVRSGK